MLKIRVPKNQLAIIILIGGKSSRFGTDKGIFEFLGIPLITYQLQILVKFDYNIFIVANSYEQVQNYMKKIQYNKLMAFIIDDKELIQNPDTYTPMIGLYTAFKELDKLGYKNVLALSCDTPLIKDSVIELLMNELNSFDCVIPKWSNDNLEPLLAIYPVKKALKKAKENLQKGVYKLIKLLEHNWLINYISVEDKIKPLDNNLMSFININGPIDIQKLVQIYEKNKNLI